MARARDEASQRGLTRAEVTFYCENDIPSEEFMEATLRHIDLTHGIEQTDAMEQTSNFKEKKRLITCILCAF